MQKGTDHQSITKIVMKEGIIIHFSTMKIGESIKIVIKTNIGIKFDSDRSYDIDNSHGRGRTHSRGQVI